MDYNDLSLFTRVVERGSFSGAARVAGLPKSSVTRSIARLERELGVRLIQRTTRQRGVTDAGRELYERVRGAVVALEEATQAVREHGREPRGIVRVTAPGDAAMLGLPEALAKLSARYPSIHVEMVLTSRLLDLVADGIDLAIRAGRLADSTLVARRVGETSLGLFASKAYLARHGRPKRVAELASHDCVLFRPRAGRATWTLASGDREETVEVSGAIGADDFAFVLPTIEAGAGIGLLPIFTGERSSALERVLPRYRSGGGAPLSVVMPSASFVPARVEIVRDFLVAHLSSLLTS